MILHKIPIGQFLGCYVAAVAGLCGPLVEVGRAISVAQHAVSGIGFKPCLVGFKKLLVCTSSAHIAPFLPEQFAQIPLLGLVHTFIVYLRQGIEFPAQCFVVGGTVGIGQRGQLSQVGILRMQGIDADAVVGIRVLPCAGDGGIIDGEHLQHALPSHGHPIHKLLQIAKIAHSKTALRAQREHGNHRSCGTPRPH